MKKIHINGAIICFLISILALAIYYGAFFNGLSQKTNQLTAQHQQNQSDLITYQNAAMHRSALKQSISRLQTQVKDSNNKIGIPPAGINDDLIKGMRKAGVAASSVSMMPSSPTNKKTSTGHIINNTPFTVIFDCNAKQLIAFSQYLEKETKAAYYIDMVSIQPQQGQNNGNAAPAGKYTASLNLTDYSFGEPSTSKTNK